MRHWLRGEGTQLEIALPRS